MKKVKKWFYVSILSLSFMGTMAVFYPQEAEAKVLPDCGTNCTCKDTSLVSGCVANGDNCRSVSGC